MGVRAGVGQVLTSDPAQVKAPRFLRCLLGTKWEQHRPAFPLWALPKPWSHLCMGVRWPLGQLSHKASLDSEDVYGRGLPLMLGICFPKPWEVGLYQLLPITQLGT